jgi:hypothetical protein
VDATFRNVKVPFEKEQNECSLILPFNTHLGTREAFHFLAILLTFRNSSRASKKNTLIFQANVRE